MGLVAEERREVTTAGGTEYLDFAAADTCIATDPYVIVVSQPPATSTIVLFQRETGASTGWIGAVLKPTGISDEEEGSNRLREMLEVPEMQQPSLQDFVATEFSQIDTVVGVYLYPTEGGVEVNTVLSTRDRVIRNTVYSRQLNIHDQFPDRSIHFTVSFSVVPLDLKNLPDDTIVCFQR